GIVTAGVGNGNMTAAAIEAITKAVEKGVVVVRSTRVPSGSVGRNVEANDDEIGSVASGELSPAKARVLLKLALLKTTDAAKIQSYFDLY
ncbi:MAG: L-asparaginase 2, partial [bacterium]|nr:L-asparaginase 2 [bacterium]